MRLASEVLLIPSHSAQTRNDLKAHSTNEITLTNLPLAQTRLAVGSMPSSKSPPPPRPPSTTGSAPQSFFEAEAADDEDDRPPPEVDSVAVGLVLSGSAAACRCAGAAVVVLEVISRPSRQSLPSVKTSHSLGWTPPPIPRRRQTSLCNSKSAHPLHGPTDRRIPRKRVSALPPHGGGE